MEGCGWGGIIHISDIGKKPLIALLHKDGEPQDKRIL